MLTNLYIDGFNLYNRAVKHTPFKWLDLRRLAETLFPHDDVQRICYVTAIVRPRPNDPRQKARQQAYLRALATLPGLEIHYGEFRERIKTARWPGRNREGPHTCESGTRRRRAPT